MQFLAVMAALAQSGISGYNTNIASGRNDTGLTVDVAAAQGKEQGSLSSTQTGSAGTNVADSSEEAMASLKEQAKGKTIGDTVSAAFEENGQVKVYTASVNESGIGLVSVRNATAQEQGGVQGNGEKVKGEQRSPNYVKLSEKLGEKLKREDSKIIDIKDAAQANAAWSDMGYDLPPVAKNTKAYNVEAGNYTYARVFKEGVNKPKSPFLLRAEDIEGLTANEIAEKYALPQVPDKVVYPRIPSNTILEVSIVGPQESWGTIGGDIQYAIKYDLLDDDWFTDIHSLDKENKNETN